jgi:hypothetical protein
MLIINSRAETVRKVSDALLFVGKQLANFLGCHFKIQSIWIKIISVVGVLKILVFTIDADSTSHVTSTTQAFKLLFVILEMYNDIM